MGLHRVVLVAGCVAALAACGEVTGEGEAPGGPGDDLAGSWELVEGEGPDGPVPLLDDNPVTLVLAGDGTVGGRAACNTYGGRFDRDGERISISELFATEMGCFPAEVMESEQAFLGALPRVETARVDDGRLVLSGEGVGLAFERLPEREDAPLTGTTWVLDTLLTGDAASNMPELPRPATLELSEDGTFSAFTGCNALDGEFSERGGGLEFAPVAITDVACPDLEDLQDHVLAVLDGEVEAVVEGDRLTLTAADGLGLGYRAEQ